MLAYGELRLAGSVPAARNLVGWDIEAPPNDMGQAAMRLARAEKYLNEAV